MSKHQQPDTRSPAEIRHGAIEANQIAALQRDERRASLLPRHETMRARAIAMGRQADLIELHADYLRIVYRLDFSGQRAADAMLDAFDLLEDYSRRLHSRVVSGTLECVWPEIVKANLAGAAIWVQVNQATGRKDKDVTRIRAYFVDLDGSDPTKLLASGSGANIIIESSPGKFHGYWLTGDGPVNEFKQRQHALAQHFGGDPSICNPGRVMRLPGTIHWKSTPYISTILRLEGTLS